MLGYIIIERFGDLDPYNLMDITSDVYGFNVYRTLEPVWNVLEKIFNEYFLNPNIAKRNPRFYIDDKGFIVNFYDDEEYPV